MFFVAGLAIAGVVAYGGAQLLSGRRQAHRTHVWLTPAPHPTPVREGAAGSPGQEETALTPLAAALAAVDDHYQRWMQRQFEMLVSRTRHEQFEVLAASDEVLAISEEEKTLNRRLARIGGVVVTALLARLLYPPLFVLAISLALYDSLTAYREAYRSIRQTWRLKMEHLAVVFFTGLWLAGYFVIGGLSFLFYGVMQQLIVRTRDRSRKNLVNIFGQQPRQVWVCVDGVEMEMPFADVRAGDTLVVQAGQMIPIDGVITAGVASIDQHLLTGEAQPVEKGVGDPVLAATTVLGGRLHIQVERTGDETLAGQIGDILRRTTDYHLSIEERGKAMADRWVVPSILLTMLAAVTLDLKAALAVLSNMPGIDLVLVAPLTLLNFLNLASRQHMLIKDGRSLELLHEVDTVLFDKTGTLTLEQPQVRRMHRCAGWSEECILTYAAAAEQRQTHPIARAMLAAAQARQLPVPAIDDAHYHIGYGIQVRIPRPAVSRQQSGDLVKNARRGTDESEPLIHVGSERFLAQEGIAVPEEMHALQDACHAQGHSLVLVAVNAQLAGAIELQPTVRPEAKAVVDALHQRQLALYIISGDQPEPTRQLAQALGIEHYVAQVLPEQKAQLVEQLQREGHTVCFVGDGINDAIALKQAQVSISPRGAASVATDTAQIVLMDQSLRRLPALFDLAHDLDRNLRTSLWLVTAPAFAVIGGVFFFHIGVPLAVAAYVCTFTASVVNAMRPVFRGSADVVNVQDGPSAQGREFPTAKSVVGEGETAQRVIRPDG